MTDLKPCPFCGRKPSKVKEHKTPSIIGTYYSVGCVGKGSKCPVKPRTRLCNTPQTAIKEWNQRTPEIVKVETSFYDQEETYPDCTVQVLTNTATGETSVGWWRNGN